MEHANRYYADLEIPYLKEGNHQLLRDRVLDSIAQGSIDAHSHTGFDHLRFFDPKPEFQDLVDLAASCISRANPIVYILPPMVTMPVHRDSEYRHVRKSTISIPLHPSDDYPDTHWYSSADGGEPIATARWEIFKPKLLNISDYHGGIETGSEWRINLQFSLSLDYEEALDAIKDGVLFGKFGCFLA